MVLLDTGGVFCTLLADRHRELTREVERGRAGTCETPVAALVALTAGFGFDNLAAQLACLRAKLVGHRCDRNVRPRVALIVLGARRLGDHVRGVSDGKSVLAWPAVVLRGGTGTRVGSPCSTVTVYVWSPKRAALTP